MSRVSRCLLPLVLVGSVPLLVLGQQPQAKSEQRVFRVSVDGRESGLYKQTITTYSEGTTDVVAQSDIKVKVVVVMYQYAYRGHERWKDNRLQYLASASNDDGVQHTLMVTPEKNQLKIKEGGRERYGNAEAWSTCYWTLPAPDRRDKTISLIDSDSGQEHQVQLQIVGKDMQTVGKQKVACTRYKVTGGIEADLWFDEKERLVRREMMRKGRKAVLELISVTVN